MRLLGIRPFKMLLLLAFGILFHHFSPLHAHAAFKTTASINELEKIQLK
jgi:hypothetical protein